MSRYYTNKWLSYRPLCYNRYTGAQYLGRPTTSHLVTEEDDPAPPTFMADDRGWGPGWWRADDAQVQGPHRVLFDYVKARHLRSARESTGLSRTRCARALGISAADWGQYENGLRTPREEHARVLRAFMKRIQNLNTDTGG